MLSTLIRVIIIIGVIHSNLPTFGQNLVPNGSFEGISTCSVSNGSEGIQSIEDWYVFETPDFFNTCFSNPIYSPPNVYSGYSFPLNFDGMVGIAMLPSIQFREGVGVKLTSELIADSAYCYSYWIKNSQQGGYVYNTEMIDCLFSSDTMEMYEIENMNYSSSYPDPTVENDIEEEIDGWKRVEGYYIASGGERHFTLSFLGDFNYTTNAPDHENALYYFVDSIEVNLCNKDSLLSVLVSIPNVFTPNLDGINDLLRISNKNIKTMTVQVFNRWGNFIYEFDGLLSGWSGVDKLGKPLSEGVYFIKVMAESKFGDSIEKNGFVHLER